jgi:cytoskeleton protein RodZ
LTAQFIVDGQEKSVGLILRETREARGLCLDDVAKVTRVGKGYLTALEEEMFDKLPSAVYIKGFLRVYANYLGLSEKDIIALYDKRFAGDQFQTTGQLPETKQAHRGKTAVGTAKKRWYLLLVLLIVATAIFHVIQNPPKWQAGVKESPVPLSVNAKPQQAESPQRQAVLPPADANRRDFTGDDKDSKNNEVVNYDSRSPKGIVLKIKVIKDGWLDITIDDAVSQHYELKAGDLIEWKGEKGFTLDIGNAGGIEAELNGKMLKSFGNIGETAHVSLKNERR